MLCLLLIASAIFFGLEPGNYPNPVKGVWSAYADQQRSLEVQKGIPAKRHPLRSTSERVRAYGRSNRVSSGSLWRSGYSGFVHIHLRSPLAALARHRALVGACLRDRYRLASIRSPALRAARHHAQYHLSGRGWRARVRLAASKKLGSRNE